MKTLVTFGLLATLAQPGRSQMPAPLGTVRIEGRVVDSLGDALPLARVVASTPGGGVEVARVLADGDGAFIMAELPRRELMLLALAPRRIGEPRRLDLDESPWLEATSLPVQLRMMDAATVRGCVKGENGKPLVGARVVARPKGHVAGRAREWPMTETDSEGKFELPTPFGRTIVCAFAVNHGPVVEEFTLVEDEIRDFVLRSSPSCELRIRYRGATAEDLDWMAFCDDGDFEPDLWQCWPQTRLDQTVTFHGLPTGSLLSKFRLFFVPHCIENTRYAVPLTPGSHDIEAPTGMYEKPDDPLVKLRGHLLDGGGRPMAGARLTRWVSPQRTEVAQTGDDGRFEMVFRTASRSQWIGLEGADYVPIAPRQERHPGNYAFNVFDIPTESKQDLVLVAERAAGISGRILGDRGVPVWGALIQIQVGDGDRPSDDSVSTLSDREGRFVLRGLRASSRYRVWLRTTCSSCEFATEQLTLRVGETLDLGDLHFGKPSVIEGELPDGEAQRAGTLLTLEREPSARAYEMWRYVYADRNGRFRFTGVPEGSYTVHVGRWPGRGAAWRAVGKATVEHGVRVVVGGR
jgi:hypothetical protein